MVVVGFQHWSCGITVDIFGLGINTALLFCNQYPLLVDVAAEMMT